MDNDRLRRENDRLMHNLRSAYERIYELDFERRTWKSGFWIMQLIAVCYIAFCLVSGNTLHG
ncbi:MAG: hypothetical protein J6L64_07950 [Opitutales bacterium]|nr:hypothetical protein [Opitutales bacterium]